MRSGEAHDTLLGRDVAVKEIWVHGSAGAPVDDKLARRALREAQAAARLRHPGIVTIHDVVTEDGRPWIVMELVRGRSLAEEIGEHGLLTEQRTGEIGRKVLDALVAAHREGIAHRDVKPANILLDGDRVVLSDFGIAAIDDATALTATGHLIGSPAYMAPERINGKPASAASDLWSLGVTLYATVTGRSPFQRDDTQATVAAILGSKPLPPPYAGRLWPVIKGLLDKDPDARLTAEQAKPLLEAVASAPGGTPPKPRRWPALTRKGSTVIAPAPTVRFSGGAGAMMWVRPDGKTTDDYNKSASLTASNSSEKWLLRGKESSRTETKDGRIFASEITGNHTWEVTRNGRRVSKEKAISAMGGVAYICTETRLTIYGTAKSSTDSYVRVSRQP